MKKLRFLSLIVVVIFLVSFVVSCNKGSSTSGTTKNGTDSSKTKLEMFSWWTGGGEAYGLAAMFKMFLKSNSKVDVVNSAVAGGAGSNAKAVLKTRIMGGDPPDTFQVHAGMEIKSWIDAGKLDNIDDLVKSEGWEEKLPKDLLKILKIDGHYYSVPVNIHRSNVLWYNKKIFDENKIKVPESIPEFFAACEKLKAKKITPITLGDNGGQWVDVHNFESILLAELGDEGYKGLWDGKTKWNDPKVKAALNDLSKLAEYINTDHSSLSWDQAAQTLVDGKSAMMIMGDWAEGYFKSKKFKDFGYAPSPGTKGTFLMLSDSFAIPKDAKNKENAIKWLKLCGSVEGQDTFNPLKGSIPARTDAGKGDYDEYLKSAMKDWSSNKIAPSLAHGAAAVEGWLTEVTDVIGDFITTKNVTKAQDKLITISEKYVKK